MQDTHYFEECTSNCNSFEHSSFLCGVYLFCFLIEYIFYLNIKYCGLEFHVDAEALLISLSI